jgi:hypothetical protein
MAGLDFSQKKLSNCTHIICPFQCMKMKPFKDINKNGIYWLVNLPKEYDRLAVLKLIIIGWGHGSVKKHLPSMLKARVQKPASQFFFQWN